jgi:hypothetical protein
MTGCRCDLLPSSRQVSEHFEKESTAVRDMVHILVPTILSFDNMPQKLALDCGTWEIVKYGRVGKGR